MNADTLAIVLDQAFASFPPAIYKRLLLACCLVDKHTWRPVATRALYRHIDIRCPEEAIAFERTILEQPGFGELVDSLQLAHISYDCELVCAVNWVTLSLSICRRCRAPILVFVGSSAA